MKARLVARGIPEHKILVAENWADGCEILPAPFRGRSAGSALFRYLRLGPRRADDYGSNATAPRRRPIPICVRRWWSTARAVGRVLSSGRDRIRVEFRPYARRSELSRSLAEGHVGLVTQIPETVGAVVPSKSLRNHGGRTADALRWSTGQRHPRVSFERHGCGWRIEPGDAAGHGPTS